MHNCFIVNCTGCPYAGEFTTNFVFQCTQSTIHTGRYPSYLADNVSLTSQRQTGSGLRSADSIHCVLSSASARLHRTSSLELFTCRSTRNTRDCSPFRRSLKTRCFSLALVQTCIISNTGDQMGIRIS